MLLYCKETRQCGGLNSHYIHYVRIAHGDCSVHFGSGPRNNYSGRHYCNLFKLQYIFSLLLFFCNKHIMAKLKTSQFKRTQPILNIFLQHVKTLSNCLLSLAMTLRVDVFWRRCSLQRCNIRQAFYSRKFSNNLESTNKKNVYT